MTETHPAFWLRRTVLAGLLGGLLWAGFVVLRLRRELLAVLTGQDAKTAHPVIGWAAMLGALAGGAVGYVRSKTARQ